MMIFDPWSITLCCFSILSTFLPILLSPNESFLDFLKNLSLWIYLSFLYFIQMSPLSLSSLFSNKYRFGFISWLEFQSISSVSKLFRLSVPRTLMPIQAIWRMELLVDHEESSRSNWKLYHLPTFLLKLDEGFRSSTKESSLREIMTLPLQSRRWSQRWTNWRRHVSSTTKLEDVTILRSTPSNFINNV